MKHEELKSLTIEKLDGMTEEELDKVAQEVVNFLTDSEIKKLPQEVKDKLKIVKEKSAILTKEFWITVIIAALIMSLIQAMLGN
ncbi:hypothetical protein [Phocaeicola plebeius]|jgi:uncharacterized membrane protein YraQ (UPF0718 family)|uniref:Uncharacterized protein n=1 Tax=Phocaeicola plebeius TaxID=310297 RepID=A0A414R704_9BACT|nr:hypothetical protein [Phocaeicola plebeius]RGR51825.1 hypothetical protein DWY45_13320 [Phocaeicola plebeius]RHF88758.1 hypothetical protein DW653_11680 [Phocaeicola plebeius]